MYDSEDDEDDDALYISLNLEAKITRVVGNLIIPSRLSIRTDVNPLESIEEAELSSILTKIRFWYDNLVSKAVAFSFDNDEALTMFINADGKNRTANLIMITPGDPTDEMLAALFQSKMTALSGKKIGFGSVEVKSDNQVGLSFTYVGSGERILPTMDKWIGERSYFERPWWSRDDASTLDVVPPLDADLTKKPQWAFKLDAFDAKTDSGIVVRPSFKPTVIPGGKPPV